MKDFLHITSYVPLICRIRHFLQILKERLLVLCLVLIAGRNLKLCFSCTYMMLQLYKLQSLLYKKLVSYVNLDCWIYNKSSWFLHEYIAERQIYWLNFKLCYLLFDRTPSFWCTCINNIYFSTPQATQIMHLHFYKKWKLIYNITSVHWSFFLLNER